MNPNQSWLDNDYVTNSNEFDHMKNVKSNNTFRLKYMQANTYYNQAMTLLIFILQTWIYKSFKDNQKNTISAQCTN